MALGLDAAKRFKSSLKNENRKTKKPVMPWEDRLPAIVERQGNHEETNNRVTTGVEPGQDRTTVGAEPDQDMVKTGVLPDQDRTTVGARQVQDVVNTGPQPDQNRTIAGAEPDQDMVNAGPQPDQDRTTAGPRSGQPLAHGRQHDNQRDIDDFSELQRAILKAICATVDRGSLVSGKIGRRTLAEALKKSNESVKSGLRRLIEIGAIERADWKDGMNGWTRYKISQRVLFLIEKSSND